MHTKEKVYHRSRRADDENEKSIQESIGDTISLALDYEENDHSIEEEKPIVFHGGEKAEYGTPLFWSYVMISLCKNHEFMRSLTFFYSLGLFCRTDEWLDCWIFIY